MTDLWNTSERKALRELLGTGGGATEVMNELISRSLVLDGRAGNRSEK